MDTDTFFGLDCTFFFGYGRLLTPAFFALLPSTVNFVLTGFFLSCDAVAFGALNFLMNFALLGTGESPLPLCRNSAFLLGDMPSFPFGLFLSTTSDCLGWVVIGVFVASLATATSVNFHAGIYARYIEHGAT